MEVEVSAGRVGWADRCARLATELLAPWVLVVALPLAVAWHATGTLAGTLGWGLVVALLSSVLPMMVIVVGARRGRWDGHHVRDRQGRLVPFVVLIALSGVGLVVLVATRAPREVLALDVAMLASLVVSAVITVWWKVSMHAAVAAGAAVVVAVTFGPATLLLFAAVALVSWSRVRLGDHTTAQVLAGMVLGVVVGGGLDALLR